MMIDDGSPPSSSGNPPPSWETRRAFSKSKRKQKLQLWRGINANVSFPAWAIPLPAGRNAILDHNNLKIQCVEADFRYHAIDLFDGDDEARGFGIDSFGERAVRLQAIIEETKAVPTKPVLIPSAEEAVKLFELAQSECMLVRNTGGYSFGSMDDWMLYRAEVRTALPITLTGRGMVCEDTRTGAPVKIPAPQGMTSLKGVRAVKYYKLRGKAFLLSIERPSEARWT